MRILICLLFSIIAVDFATAAGCEISLRVKNQTEYALHVDIRSTVEDLAVKTRAVPWRGVQKGEWDWEPTGTPVLLPYPRQSGVPWWIDSWLLPGETQFDTYKAVLGCGFKRRYRLRFTCHELGAPNPHPEAPQRRIFK